MADELGSRGFGLNVYAKAWNGEGGVPNSTEEAPREKTICTFFAMGGCRKGSGCPYSHDLTQEAPAGVDASSGFYISGRVANLNASAAAPAPASTAIPSSSSFRQISPTTAVPSQPPDRSQFTVASAAPMQAPKSSGFGFASTIQHQQQQQQQLGGYDVAGGMPHQQLHQQQLYNSYVAAGAASSNQMQGGRLEYEYDPQQQQQQQYYPTAAYNAPPQQQPQPDMGWQPSTSQQQGLVSIGYQQGPVPTTGYDINGNPVLYMPQGQQQQQQQVSGMRMAQSPQQSPLMPQFVEQQWNANGAGVNQQSPLAPAQAPGMKYVPMAAGPQRQTPLSSPAGTFGTSPTASYVAYATAPNAPYGRDMTYQQQPQQYAQQAQATYSAVNGTPAGLQYGPGAFKNVSQAVQTPTAAMQQSFQPYPQPQQQQQQSMTAATAIPSGYQQLGPAFSQHQQQQAAFFNNEFITSNYMSNQHQQQHQFQTAVPGGLMTGEYGPGPGMDMMTQQLQPSMGQDGNLMQHSGYIQAQQQQVLQPQQQQQQLPPQQQQQWNNSGMPAQGTNGSQFLPPSTSFSTSTTLFRSADLFPPVAAAPPLLAGSGVAPATATIEPVRTAPQVPRSIDSEDLPLPARRQAMPSAPMPLQ